MGNLNSWIKKQSLSQQLFTLIFAFITFFCFFFFIYIGDSISTYTDEQMYSTLEQYQSNLRVFYTQSLQYVTEEELNNSSSLIIDNNTDILTYYYVIDEDKTVTNLYCSQQEVDNDLLEEIQTNLIRFSTYESTINSGLSGKYQYDGDSQYSYYIISQLDDQTYIVNIMNSSYAIKFKSDLISSVVDITVFVVGVFFIILMFWVGAIIRPLNQIRIYIEKIKVGKEATLNINREDEIGEVAKALITMREELQRQEKVKEEMVHNISHDLKTPIATIKSYGESIKDGIYPYDTLEKSVDVIIDNAERLEKKVHSLLFLNRVEYLLNSEYEETFCDMKEVVKTVVLNTKVIRPEIEIETNLISTKFKGGDEAWRVAVENLLENALRYAQTQIVITLEEDRLCIFNDGVPIDESSLGTMFKAYEKGSKGQFGLGLSIVKKVATANKYQVSAENVEYGGVIFIITK